MTQDLSSTQNKSGQEPQPKGVIDTFRLLFSNFDRELVKFAQSIFRNIPGLTVLSIISGFIVVNSYLAKYTGVHGYSVVLGQYIAASIQIVFFGIVLYVLFQVIFGIVQSIRMIRDILRVVRQPNNSLRTPIKLKNYVPSDTVLVLIAICLTILGSPIYGTLIYEHIPRYLGGGAPARVTIILTEETIADVFNIPTSHPNVNIISDVLLLAELNDGILVYEPNSKISSIIKNNQVQAIFDANSLHPDGTPRSITVPTSEATETATQESLP